MTRESKVLTSVVPNGEESVTSVVAPVENPATVVENATTAQAAAEPASEAAVRAEAARARAAQFITERRYADAKKALDEAESIESEQQPHQNFPGRVMSAVRYQLNRLPKRSKSTEEATPSTTDPEVALATMEPEERALAIVGLYSKIAAVAGLVPGGMLNFAAILAVQVTMVWRIADTFGHREAKNRIRGIILALIGSAIPTGVGGGVMFAIRSIPAFIAGTVAGFVVTPVVAYALTQAVGNTFVMHFESGGTLLDFDPRAFRDYFIKEFQEAGGALAAPSTSN